MVVMIGGAVVVIISGTGVVRDFVMVMCTCTRWTVSPAPGTLDLQSAGISFVTYSNIEFVDFTSSHPVPVFEGQCRFARLGCTEAILRHPLAPIPFGVRVVEERFSNRLSGKIKVKCDSTSTLAHFETYSDPFCKRIAE